MREGFLKLVSVSLLLTTIGGIFGCAMKLGTDSADAGHEEFRSLDEVKLLAPGYTGTDPATFQQSSYTIAPESRLLLRFQTLRDSAAAISPEKGRIYIRVTAVDKDKVDEIKDHLKAYPVTQDWFMDATWKMTGSFPGAKRWVMPGGSFEQATSFSGSLNKPVAPTPTPSPALLVPTDEIGAVYFDVTDWFLIYPRGRGEFFGLILVSDFPVQIRGDAPGTYSPRIYWSE